MMTDSLEKKSDAGTPPDARRPWVKPTLERLALKDALGCTFSNMNDSMTGS